MDKEFLVELGGLVLAVSMSLIVFLRIDGVEEEIIDLLQAAYEGMFCSIVFRPNFAAENGKVMVARNILYQYRSFALK